MIKQIRQILLAHPMADFCTLGLAHSPIGPRCPHPRGWPRSFSDSSPDPYGPVIKLTGQILISHPLADFWTLGFAPSPKGPRWPHPRDGSRPIALTPGASDQTNLSDLPHSPSGRHLHIWFQPSTHSIKMAET